MRLFRKIIKKKNEILMKIFQGRFKSGKIYLQKEYTLKKLLQLEFLSQEIKTRRKSSELKKIFQSIDVIKILKII